MMNSMTRGTVERFRHQTLDTLLITAALRFRQNVDRIAAASIGRRRHVLAPYFDSDLKQIGIYRGYREKGNTVVNTIDAV